MNNESAEHDNDYYMVESFFDLASDDVPGISSYLIIIRRGDELINTHINRNGNLYEIEIDKELAAIMIRSDEDWDAQTRIADRELMDFITGYLDDYNL